MSHVSASQGSFTRHHSGWCETHCDLRHKTHCGSCVSILRQFHKTRCGSPRVSTPPGSFTNHTETRVSETHFDLRHKTHCGSCFSLLGQFGETHSGWCETRDLRHKTPWPAAQVSAQCDKAQCTFSTLDDKTHCDSAKS